MSEVSEVAETPAMSEGTKDVETNDSNESNKSAQAAPISTPVTESSAPEIYTDSSSTLTSVSVATSSTTPSTCSASSNTETSVVSAEATKSKALSPQELDKNWEDLGVHRCPICKFTTDQEELFKNHTTSCTASKIIGIVKLSCVDKQFTCHACNDTTWINQSEFEEHIVVHIQDLPYVCLSCKNDFSSRRKIELHVKQSHPDGVARSGLRGMKKGRKCIQDLLENGSVSIRGKLSIPKTPHNQSSISQKHDGASEISTANISPVEDIAQEKTSKQVVDHPESNKEEIEETNRPMPPPRTSSNLVLGPNKINNECGNLVSVYSSEQAKKDHLDSLFGELNTSSNSVQPTYVSQKIRNIANPTGTVHHRPISSVIAPRPPPTLEVVASIGDTTHTTSAQKISSPLSFTAPQKVSITNPQQVILVPVGNPVPPSSTSLGQRLIVPASLKSQNVHVQIKPVSPAILPGNQLVASDVNLSTPVVGNTNRQPVSKSPDVRTSQAPALISFLPIAQKLRPPPPPYPGSAELGRMPLQSTPIVASTIKALQNLAGLVCPGKQSVPVKAVASENIQHQTNQFVNLDALMPQFSVNAPVPSSGALTFVSNISSVNRCSSPKKETKFLFKRDAKRGLVCEFCRKYTKEEVVFRKHIWDHFHNAVTKACKRCTPKNIKWKEILLCPIVNEIVSSLERQNRQTAELPTINLEQTEVIDITDDDNDVSDKNVNKEKATEVIVLDDEEEDNTNSGLQIQITSAFSITSNSDLEQMSKDPVNSFEVVNNQSKGPPGVGNVSPETNTNEETVNPKYPALQVLLQPNEQSNVVETKEKEKNEEKEQLIEADDNFVKSIELVDKSLSEPNNDSESIVLQLLETNLEEFNPTKKVGNETVVQTTHPCAENHENNSDLKQNQTESTVQNVEASSDGKKDADKNIPINQSRSAFYVCGYEGCSFRCFLSNKYKQHLKSAQHQKEYNYVCGHCGHKDYMEDAHVRHVFSHASAKSFILYKCPIRLCKYKTNLLHLYKVHLKAHPSEELVSISCNYCNKIFPKIEDLVEHLKQNLLKFIVCTQCSFKFGNRSVVMKHMKVQHPDRLRYVTVTSQIVCNEREINFYVHPPLKHFDPAESEQQVLPNDNPHVPIPLDIIECKEYEKASEEQTPVQVESENEDALSLPEEDQSEIKRNAGQPKNKDVKASHASNVNISDGPVHLLCKHCTYLSYNQALYLQHLSLHQAELNRDKKFVCNLCPLSTDNIASFRKHMRNHIGKNQAKFFTCTDCSYCSNLKCHIMDHVRDAHPTPAMYTMSSEVIQSDHYECRFCDFPARTWEQIRSHETYEHGDSAGLSRNKSISDKPSRRSSVDLGESDTKTKKLKYHCEYCNQFFKHKANLKEHLSFDHSDIENKQFVFFKCKYCPYTSTMKERIISHLQKEHKNMEPRILRKIESVESRSSPAGEGEVNKAISTSGDAAPRSEDEIENASTKHEESDGNKTEVVIPDGNIFKQPFKCPKCEFSASTRLKTMMHLKISHPKLKPVRPSQDKTASRKTARKSSTSSLLSSKDIPKRPGALMQNIPETVVKNPFTAVKESVMRNESSIEDQSDSIANPSSDHYTLGEQNLHSALSACFIPSELDMNFQCRICKQKIFKKFVLHRHILNHLKIVFFRCRFCEEGSIERTLMIGHIQKCHPQLPLLFSTVDKVELQSSFKEKIFSQNFNDTVGLQSENVPKDRGVTGTNRIDIVKKPVHEYQTIEDSDEETIAQEQKSISIEGQNEEVADNVDKIKEKSIAVKKTKGPYKCSKCRYVTHTIYLYNMHIETHNDPNKKCTCSVCDFRGTRYSVIKHMYNVFHSTPPKVNYDDDEDNEAGKGTETRYTGGESDISASDGTESIPENPLTAPSVDHNTQSEERKKGIRIAKNNDYAYKLKTIFKCKECGEKRESRTSIYEHFKTSKCNKPMYKCSLCSFTNKLKSVIRSHARKRHHGKKFTIMTLPINTKFRTITVPVRLAGQSETLLSTQNSVEDSNSSSSGSVSPVTVEKEDERLHCLMCSSYVCQSVVKLQFHINTRHNGVKLQCNTCSYKTPLVQHMLNHCRNVHRHKVAQYSAEKVSPSIKTNKTEVVEVQDGSNSGNELEYKCPKCSKKFSRFRSVWPHLHLHFKYKPFECRYCDLTSNRSANIKQHTSRCHPGKPVKVDIKKNPAIDAKMNKAHHSFKLSVSRQKISLGLSRPSKLDNYELVEKGIRRNGDQFYCDICNFSAPKKSRVKVHLNSVHRKRFLESDSDSERISPPRKVIKLENSTDTNRKYKEQMDEKSPLRYKVIKSQGVKKLQCLQCDYKTEILKYMKQHKRRTHEIKSPDSKSYAVKLESTESKKNAVIGRAYKCYYCNYSSPHTSSDVWRHLKYRHSSKPSKMISKTGSVLSLDGVRDKSMSPTRSSLSSSPARSLPDSCNDSPIKPPKKVTGNTKFSCNMCPYSAEGMFHFRLHLLEHKEFTKFTTEIDTVSQLTCGYCCYIGKNMFDLNVHVATHMSDMRFKCAYCDYAQFHCAKVILHLRYAHSDLPELVVDRQKKKFTEGVLKLVNFNPVLKLPNISSSPVRKKKFRRIQVETVESPDESDVVLEKMMSRKKGKHKVVRMEYSIVKKTQPKMKIKIMTSRAASAFKKIDVETDEQVDNTEGKLDVDEAPESEKSVHVKSVVHSEKLEETTKSIKDKEQDETNEISKNVLTGLVKENKHESGRDVDNAKTCENELEEEFNETADVDIEIKENAKEENLNVFEKFTAGLEVNSDCSNEDTNHGTDADANIFEKFNQNQMEDADNADNVVSKNLDVEDESDENIFDKFEFVDEEMDEKDKESDICEEENIFDKFTKTGTIDNSGSKSIESNPETVEKNLTDEVPMELESDTKKTDETSSANVDTKHQEELPDKEIVNASDNENHENMEVDELINSIEDNIRENSQCPETNVMDSV